MQYTKFADIYLSSLYLYTVFKFGGTVSSGIFPSEIDL